MLIKFCGIQSVKELNADIIKRTDYFGVIFSPLSKRRITDFAMLIKIKNLIPKQKLVFVFKGNPIVEIEDLIKKYNPLMIQVYEEDIQAYFEKRITILRAYNLISENSLSQINQNHKLIILEGKSSGKAEPIAFDLQRIPFPYILAGGINESNIKSFTHLNNCIGFDMASGIEEQGITNSKKMLNILA